MKKLSRMLCALLLAACMCACSATAEELTGEAEGYGGPLKVAVTVTDGKISQVKVTSHQETEGVGTRAIDELPAAIVAAGMWTWLPGRRTPAVRFCKRWTTRWGARPRLLRHSRRPQVPRRMLCAMGLA